MKNLIAFLSLLFLFFYPGVCFGIDTLGTSAPVFDIFPKSPEAAAISKYGSIPINLTTGVPNINIPIWTMQLRGLTVPISLNYNSSGIKVNEHATNVGLGWSLSSGGAVTSSVHGLPDLQPRGWVYPFNKTPQTGTFKEDWTGSDPNFLIDSTYVLYTNSQSEKTDTQPDLFFMSYLGKSIKFFYDQQGGVHLMPYKRVKIEGPPYNYFRLTDENDNVYIFNDAERSRTSSDAPTKWNDHGFVHIVDNYTYYLSTVITPYGDTVRFHYSGQSSSFKNPTAETRFEQITQVCNRPDDRAVHSTTAVEGVRISSIASSKGDSVVFNYNTADRFDMPGSQSLASIVVLKKNNSAFSKTVSFSYGYFGSPGVLPTPADAQDNSRLRLDTVRESGKSPYVFTYNPNVPNRLSMAEDHWGYYNGKSNTTLLPVDPGWGFSTGANRDPDPAYVQGGILTTIKYPTGGKSVFTYEPNTFYHSTSTFVYPSAKVTATGSTSAVNTVNFTIPSGAYDFYIKYTTPSEHMDDLEPFGQFTTIQIKQGSTLVRQISGSNGDYEPISLSAGSYTFRVCKDVDNIGVYVTLYYRLESESTTVTTASNDVRGGIRIKAIDDYAVDGTVASNTSYDYSGESDTTMSSNSIEGTPTYRYTHYSFQPNGGSGYFDCSFRAQGSSSVLQLAGDGGTNAYYTNVKVYKRNKAGNGYTNYSFLPPKNSGDNVGPDPISFPFPPLINYDWFNDQVAEKKEYRYNSSTGLYNLIAKTVNGYKMAFGASLQDTNIHESYVRGIKIATLRPGFTGSNPLPPLFAIHTYDLCSTWFYPILKRETSYDPIDTNKKVTTTTNFYYDNPKHIELTREEVTKSTGEHYNVLMRYPKDYNAAYPYYSSPMVEKRVMINDGSTDRLTKAEVTTYKNQPGSFPNAFYGLKNDAPTTPSSVSLYDGTTIDAAYERQVDYTYDTNNNMATITKEGISSMGYHWGYRAEYPIAGCTNATAAQFYYEGYEENGTTGTSHTGKRYSTTAAVAWAQPANGRAYVYSYWYLDSGTWKYSGEQAYNGSSFTMSGGTAFDDVRIHPKDSQMTTYTYDPAVGVTSMTDAKGQTSYYEYDSFQRLLNVKDQYGNIVKHSDYHYQGQ